MEKVWSLEIVGRWSEIDEKRRKEKFMDEGKEIEFECILMTCMMQECS